MLATLIEGFLISFGLVIAIGPQNAYVLRQGLKKHHAGLVASVCFLSDIALITLGVLGVGAIIAASEPLKFWLGWGGAVFLLWFAFKSARSAMSPEPLTDAVIEGSAGAAAGKGARIAVLHALAFTFLNPWVYMDTMGIIGTYSVKLGGADERLYFLIGAVLGSGTWFYGLAYFAGKAAPLFKKQVTWQILDSAVALLMMTIAGLLVAHQLST